MAKYVQFQNENEIMKFQLKKGLCQNKTCERYTAGLKKWEQKPKKLNKDNINYRQRTDPIFTLQ